MATALPQDTSVDPLPAAPPRGGRVPRARRAGLLTWLALLIAGLFLVPVVSVLINLALPSDGTWDHLASTVLPDYIANSLWLVAGVGLGVLVIGSGTAWLVTMCRFPGRRFFEWALILPLAVPAYVMAYTYTDFLQFAGPVQTSLRELMGWQAGDYWFPQIRSLGGAIAMLVFVLYPYVYLLARAAFLEQSVCALEVSRTLGCNAWGSFVRVALPLLIGFLLPGGILLQMAIEVGDSQLGPRFIGLALNSFTVAAITAVLAVLLALLMAYSLRLHPNRLGLLANRVASMGYAVPGTVIAVGVLLPFALLDNTIDAWFRQTFGVSTGLLLTGSIAALVFAYLVRFLAVSLNTVEASLAKVRPSMDDASRNLGQSPAGTLLRVHAPIMFGSLMTAGLLVFVDVMKELPATLVMRPFNFDTLAVQAYNLAADERLTESSTASLTIVAVGVLPLILLSRAIARSRPGQNGG